jgi:hypothetical protein
LLPSALDTTKPGGPQLGQMLFHASDKPVVVQKAPARLEETINCRVAREDLFAPTEVMEDDRGYRELERSSDLLRP